MDRRGNVENLDFVFSAPNSKVEFRLEVRSHGLPFQLFRDGTSVGGLGPLTLRLLKQLLAESGRVVTHEDIRRDVWNGDAGGDPGRHISFLRDAFGDRSEPHRFIKKHFGRGYEFLCSPTLIERPADESGGTARIVSAHPVLHEKWDRHLFLNLLEEIQEDDVTDAAAGDLKIVSSLFHDVMDLGFQDLLLRGKHLKILVMNPENRALIRARYSRHRKDFGSAPEVKALKDLRRQIAELIQMPSDLAAETGQCRGTLEVRVSDIMPCGFMVAGRKRLLFGAMLAHRSYIEGGPMVEVRSEHSKLWGLLNGDWKARWEDATDPKSSDR